MKKFGTQQINRDLFGNKKEYIISFIMGWLQLGRKSHHHHKPTRFGLQSNDVLKEAAQHVENISLADNHLNLQHDPAGARRYPPVSQSLPNNELPFIPVSEIMKRTSAENGGLCMCSLFFLNMKAEVNV